MVDTKTPGDKTLSVPTKTLTLKPRVETGTVRQSFSHGRTKQVVVEKRGKRRVGGDAPAPETHAPEPVVAKAAPPAAKAPMTRAAPPPAQPRSNSGVVLRTLTEDERSARASALADAKVRDVEERRLAEEGAKAQGRAKSKEAFRRGRSQGRYGSSSGHDGPPCRARRASARYCRRYHRRGRRSAPDPSWPRRRRPSRSRTEDDREARTAEAARPPDAGHSPQCRRCARALDRIIPPPHPATQGTCVERAEGKARSRGGHPGSHQYPGTRQPHVGARRRRHQAADEAGRDAQDHRRDRCRHRAADRRGTRSYR